MWCNQRIHILVLKPLVSTNATMSNQSIPSEGLTFSALGYSPLKESFQRNELC